MKLKKDKVKLFVRVRPTGSPYSENVKFIGDKILEVERPGLKPLSLVTDGIMSNNSQKEVHHNVSKLGVIKNLFEGYSTCIMAYGIDTAGKSFTLFGCVTDFQQRGLILRYISNVFDEIHVMPSDKITTVKMSAVTLCGDYVYDLLSPQGLNIDKHSTVHNYSNHVVNSEKDAFCLFFLARANKKKLEKICIKRSHGDWTHFIFNIKVEIKSTAHSETKVLGGNLKFVELAGAVGDLVEPVTKEQLIARETISIMEHDLIDKHTCPAVDKPSCRRCKLSYLLKDVICGQALLILILSVRIEKEFNKSLVHTIMFGQRLLHFEIKAEATIIHDTFGLKESLTADVDNLKLELYQRDILANRRPQNYGSLNDMQRKKLFTDIQDFLSGKNERIKVYTQTELQTAFEMVRNIHKSMHQQNELQIKFEKEIVKGTFSTAKILSQEMVAVVDLLPKKRKDSHYSREATHAVSDEENGETSQVGTQDSNTLLTLTIDEEMKLGSAEDETEADKELIESENDVSSQRSEAFEEFKLRFGKHLHDDFSSHKALTEQKKIEFNRLLHLLREAKKDLKKLMETYQEVYASTRDPTTSEELSEMLDRLEIHKQQTASMTSAAISALGEVRASQKIGHQKRQQFLRTFDSWYEKKLSSLRYQYMLGTKEYQQVSAMTPKKTHRKPCRSIGTLTKTELKFREAKRLVQNWLKFCSTVSTSRPCDDTACPCEVQVHTFDFLNADDSD